MKYELENTSLSNLPFKGSTISAGRTMTFTMNDSDLRLAGNTAELRVSVAPEPEPDTKSTTRAKPRKGAK